MNIFEEFMTFREVELKEGEITMDKQRVVILPINFLGLYLLKLIQNPDRTKELYASMKAGMIRYSKPLGEEYSLTRRDFLDRWVKYCAFTGWGVVEYQLIEEEANFGFLHVKNLPLHLYLQKNGVKEPLDVIFEGLLAGGASGTFRTDIDVIETECICAGKSECIYYWGTREHLREKFPEIASKQLGND